jgi:hypothetical protein
MSQPLITSPLPILKVNGGPFLLASPGVSHLKSTPQPPGGFWGLTIEQLAVKKLANVAHADLVAVLDSATSADLSVVNGDALDDLDTGGGGLLVSGLLGLLLGRASRALLKLLGELNLLIGLGRGGRLLGSSLRLELLLLLFAELLAILGHQFVETLSLLLSRALVLALLGLDKLGSLLFVGVNLLDTGDALNLVKLVTELGVVELIKARREIVLVVGVLIVLLLVSRNYVVSGEVDGVGSRNEEEDALALEDGDVNGLLVVLWIG